MADKPTTLEFEIDEGFDRDSKVMGTQSATQMIVQRLMDGQLTKAMREAGIAGGQGPNVLLVNAVAKMVEMLPEDARRSDVLKHGDLRVFLDLTIKAMDADGAVGPNQQFRDNERKALAIALADQDKKITNEIQSALTEGVPQGDTFALEQAITSARNTSSQYTQGKMIRVPEIAGKTYVDPASGTYKASTGSTDSTNSFVAQLNDLVSGGSGVNATRFLSGEDVRLLFQSGELNLDALNAIETMPIDQRGQIDGRPVELRGEQGVNYNDETTRRTYGIAPGLNGRADNPGRSTTVEMKEWYSVREILQKPNEMSREELQAIHEKLKKSGLYEMVGGEPVIPGDPTDPAFKAAWRQLASMSLEKGQSMTSILQDRVGSYQAELISSLSTQLTDPARLRINGDAYATDALGRKLTPSEHTEMIQFLHGLERRNAMVAAGLDHDDNIGSIDDLDEGVMADIDAQMATYLEDKFATEAGASDVADQYDMFTRMLAGPGRGVS